MRSAWQDLIIDPEDVSEISGGTVVVAVRLKAVGRSSGIKADLSFGNVWRIESGLIVSYTSYPSYEEALEAVAPRV